MKFRFSVCLSLAILSAALAMALRAAVQDRGNGSAATDTANPTPLINEPLVPNVIRPGSTGFTLTVNGTGFVSGSIVKWNGSARVTTFVSGSQLKVEILATDIAKSTTATVTVTNPTPGGGTSNDTFLEVTNPASSVSMRRSDFPAGTNSISVVTGDFNGDGKLDLAVANFQGDNTISMLLGNGNAATWKLPTSRL